MSTPRSCSVLAFAIVASAMLAGCASPGGEGPARTVSAQQALDAMRPEAEAWQADADLVLISGVEASGGSMPNREVPDDEGRSSPAAPEDASVGDGRAPTWTAMFYSEAANTTRSFRFTPGGVEDTGEAEPPTETPRVLTNWTVDSSDAVGTAMSNQSFRQGALAGDGVVIMTLGMRRDVPVWQLIARSPDRGLHTQILVDAADGTIMGPAGR